MKSKLSILVLFIAFASTSCKNVGPSFSDYQYADKPDFMLCPDVNSKLLKEATYSFEDDILKYYEKKKAGTPLYQAYTQFVRDALYTKSLNYREIASEHSLKVFEALKAEGSLWDANNPNSYLDYKSPAMKCIAINIHADDLKQTLDALIQTNSMSPALYGPAIMQNTSELLKDKYLATYVALDFFYAKLFNVDTTATPVN